MKILYTHYPHQLPPNTFNSYLQLLPKPIQQKILRYRRWQDQQAGLWGKSLLIKGLDELKHGKSLLNHLQYTAYQRPYFPKHLGLNLDFNISHSGFAVACVISEKQRIGIDIEQIRPIEIHHFTQQFSPKEIQQMHDADDPQNAFFERWCQKEAIIKVDGRGLSIPLPQVHIEGKTAKVEKQIFYLKELSLVEEYVSYLASTEPIEEIEVKKVEIEEFLSL